MSAKKNVNSARYAAALISFWYRKLRNRFNFRKDQQYKNSFFTPFGSRNHPNLSSSTRSPGAWRFCAYLICSLPLFVRDFWRCSWNLLESSFQFRPHSPYYHLSFMLLLSLGLLWPILSTSLSLSSFSPLYYSSYFFVLTFLSLGIGCIYRWFPVLILFTKISSFWGWILSYWSLLRQTSSIATMIKCYLQY